MADGLRVRIFSSRAEMGATAAKDVAAAILHLLQEREELNIVFAAAPSQAEFLAEMAAQRGIPWQRLNAFHMDEYIGLSPDAPQGFGNLLRERLFGLVPFRSVHYIDPAAASPAAECDRYAALLRANPPDLVCMGIGENGHIAFNDPHVAFFNDPEAVKVIELDLRCRTQQVNDGCFASLADVPTHAVTLTIPTLVAAGTVLCMVPASSKAEAVYRTVRGPVTEQCPASILRRHSNATLYLDPDSAAQLEGEVL